MINQIKSLSEKYSGRLPRYTSYPTAVELRPNTDSAIVREALQNLDGSGSSLSLYVHLPYCKSLCYFCACNKVITQDETLRYKYLKDLEKEICLYSELHAHPVSVAQIHLGGGSPSYLSVEELETLNLLLSEGFECSPEVCKSIEIDPRTFSDEKARVLVNQGYTRFSLGVQDFDPSVQEIVNRIQPFELTKEVTNSLRDLGIGEINFDLIYGLPGQTKEGFAETLRKVCELRPERIALYGFANVAWKVKVQNVFKRASVPDSKLRLDLFLYALSVFEDHGYEYIGLDHFALPEDELTIAQKGGSLRRNFMGYTTISGAGVLGLGVSAISDISGTMFQNHIELEKYQQELRESKLPIAKSLVRTGEDLIRSYIIERLMCDCSLSLEELRRNFPSAPRAEMVFTDSIGLLKPFEQDGLLDLDCDKIQITPLGRFFMRNIVSVFDAYLRAHQVSEKPVFSQAV